MSLDIRIDGLSVELGAGSRLDMSLVNPHFDYAKIPGSTAKLPIFPLTRRNQHIFGYWEQPQAAPSILQRRRLEQYYNGHLVREATYVLTEAGDKGYAGQMVELLGEFFGDWQNTLLSELNFGTVALPAVVSAAGVTLDGQTCLVFPTIVNPDFYGTNGSTISYTGKVNNFVGGAYSTTGPMVPMVMLTWLLKKIATATNTTIDGALLNHPAYSKLFFYNTRSLDNATTVTIRQHLPDLTVADLMLELRKLFNLRLGFDLPSRKLTIDFWQNAISKPAILDWSSKAVGRPLKTPEINTRLWLSYDLDGNDALMKDKPILLADYQSPGINANFATLKSRISTLLMDNATGTAKARQPGITSQFGQGSNTFSPRLLFWNPTGGMPLARNSLLGYGLHWNAEPDLSTPGLYGNHWHEMEAMRQGQFYAKQSINLTETDLAMLRWENKVHLNGVDYFVLSVEVSLPIRQPAECLLVAA